MSNSDDLDDVFGPLRSSATTPELANEATTVDAMTHAHIASKGRITMLNSRKARVATLIAAGIIGFGGVAAAGPGGFQSLELPDEESVETTIATTVPDEPEETEQPETTTETTEVPESSVVTTTEAPEIQAAQKEEAEEVDVPVTSFKNDPDTDFNEETCLPGNHGKTVSAAARGDDDFEGKNEDGTVAEVSDAAHSSCGKKSDAEHEEETEAEKAADSDDDNSDDDDSDHDDDEGDDDSDGDNDDDDDHDEKVEKPAKKSGNSASKDKGGNGRGQNKKGD
jgi:hypothetical protein